ncbi:hypothetical protein J6590_026616 [Homalodisca vitripennis]|nr:hypothetical protein J6590_026616 [Homalodisca vitripennis]
MRRRSNMPSKSLSLLGYLRPLFTALCTETSSLSSRSVSRRIFKRINKQLVFVTTLFVFYSQSLTYELCRRVYRCCFVYSDCNTFEMAEDLRSEDIINVLEEQMSDVSDSDISADNFPDDYNSNLEDFSSGSGEEFQPDPDDLGTSSSDEETNNVHRPSTSRACNPRRRPRQRQIQSLCWVHHTEW